MNVSEVAEGKKLLKQFEYMRDLAELKVLSALSLERPLDEVEYERIMLLKRKVFDTNQKYCREILFGKEVKK